MGDYFFNLPVLFFTDARKKLSAENYIKKHGFQQVFYVNVPVINKKFNLENAWEFIGFESPQLDESLKKDFEGQKNTIYHLMILKYVIQNSIDKAIILEDDIEFHPDFKALAPIYYEYSPTEYDIIYMGSKNVDETNLSEIVIDIPIKGNHAYIITLEGAKKLFHILISQPIFKFEDTLYNQMIINKHERIIPLNWYVWNENIFDKLHSKKQLGLVYKKQINSI